MTTYKQAGVDIQTGDAASHNAAMQARKTFTARRDMIGQPIVLENGFSGTLDMGDYYLIQNDDGVGTKIMVAQTLDKYDTIGIDLLATVLDDAICLGAEVISVTNVIDTDHVDPQVIDRMLDGLQKEACKHHVVLPGGEIAELKDMAKGYIWNATAVGIVEKEKLITGSTIKPSDPIIALNEPFLRANGFTLARHILEKRFGEKWPFEVYENTTWGELLLTPSTIYHSAVLEIHGRFKQKPKLHIKGIAHITGGGIPGNLPRILPKGFGATLKNIFEPHPAIVKLQEFGQVTDEEAYMTWNMGNGMLMVCHQPKELIKELENNHIKAQIVGEITDTPEIIIQSKGYLNKELRFEI